MAATDGTLGLAWGIIDDTRLIFLFLFLQGSEGGSSARISSRRAGEEPHIGKYRLLKTIGKGNFAKVKLAKHLPTGKEVCTVRNSSSTWTEKFKCEIL